MNLEDQFFKQKNDGCNSCLGPLFHRNFGRLVLGCIDSYDSEKWRILQHFSKSTRFAPFCTVLISESMQICVKNLLFFAEISQKFSNILQKKKIRENPDIYAKNMRKICKIWDWSGAKECKSCRSRKMQKNASLLAIVAVHTAENEPSEVGEVPADGWPLQPVARRADLLEGASAPQRDSLKSASKFKYICVPELIF